MLPSTKTAELKSATSPTIPTITVEQVLEEDFRAVSLLSAGMQQGI